MILGLTLLGYNKKVVPFVTLYEFALSVCVSVVAVMFYAKCLTKKAVVRFGWYFLFILATFMQDMTDKLRTREVSREYGRLPHKKARVEAMGGELLGWKRVTP